MTARQHFHQVQRRTGRIDRVPSGETPVVELLLWDTERIVSMTLAELPSRRDRKTVDWYWFALVDVDCGEVTP